MTTALLFIASLHPRRRRVGAVHQRDRVGRLPAQARHRRDGQPARRARHLAAGDGRARSSRSRRTRRTPTRSPPARCSARRFCCSTLGAGATGVAVLIRGGARRLVIDRRQARRDLGVFLGAFTVAVLSSAAPVGARIAVGIAPARRVRRVRRRDASRQRRRRATCPSRCTSSAGGPGEPHPVLVTRAARRSPSPSSCSARNSSSSRSTRRRRRCRSRQLVLALVIVPDRDRAPGDAQQRALGAHQRRHARLRQRRRLGDIPVVRAGQHRRRLHDVAPRVGRAHQRDAHGR